MVKNKGLLFFLFLFVFFFNAHAEDFFTPEESAYIARNPSVRIGVAESKPYTFYDAGTFRGFSIDVLHEIEKVSGLRFELTAGNWSDVYNSFLKGRLDALNEVSFTDEREKLMLFTQPYHIRKTVFFTRSDTNLPEKDRLRHLKGKKVGIIKDIFYHNSIKDKGLDLTEFSNFDDMMRSLAFGWTDAAVTNELTGLFIARANSLSNIKSAGAAGIKEIADEDFRISVQKDNPVLQSILKKSIKKISEYKLKEITNRWTVYMGQELTPSTLSLTPGEIEYIKQHPAVSVGMLRDYAPFSYEYQGGLTGYVVSLLDVISSKSGLKFTYSLGNWSSLLNNFKNGKTDMIANISYTPQRREFTLFTEEYYKIPNVIFIRDDYKGYGGLNSLSGKRVGITKDVFFRDILKGILKTGIAEYETQDDMMRDLSFGRLDAVITAFNTGNSLIKKYALLNVKIAEQFSAPGVNMEDLRFGVNPSQPELLSIMQKTMNSLTPEEKLRLENIWMDSDSYAKKSSMVMFNKAEQTYLEQKKTIRMCVDPAWMPFEQLTPGGKHEGIAADFFELIKKRSDINITVVTTANWEQSLKYGQNRKCDIFSMAMETESRKKFMNFTTPYFIVPNVIATSAAAPYIDKIDDFLDQKFGIVKGYAFEEILRRQYPGIKLITAENDADGLAMLQRGDIFGYIGTMASIGYQIQIQKITDIKISGRLPQEWRLSIATRNDEPVLNSIFEKLVLSIDENDKKQITDKWMSVKYEQGFDYSLFWKIIAIILLILLMIAYWSNKLRKLNNQLKEANEKLKELSERDALTGLYNRRYFSAHGESVLGLCQRSGIRFSIAILDIDHFKNINDTYGHQFGDLCIQKMGEILSKSFARHTDTTARYGGEEFAVFTAGGDADSLFNRMEMVRKEMESLVITGDKDIKAKITISAGVYSCLPGKSDTLDTVVKHADDALYTAKNSGRNRVIKNGKEG